MSRNTEVLYCRIPIETKRWLEKLAAESDVPLSQLVGGLLDHIRNSGPISVTKSPVPQLTITPRSALSGE